MKIVVCLKQVPSRDAVLRLNAEGTWIRETDLSFEVNEPDTYALEEALRLKEKLGGEVIVCSLGPARAQQAIKEALAKGADRAIHLDDPAFAGLDPHGVARVLARAIAKEQPDLVLTGLQSDDSGYAQAGVLVAEMLGFPHSTIIMEIQVTGSALKVKRELEGGWFQWVAMPMPAVLTIQSGINQLRYATLKGIMAAKKKEIRRTAAPAGVAVRQKILSLYVPEKAKKTQMISGSSAEAAKELVRRLRDEARVL